MIFYLMSIVLIVCNWAETNIYNLGFLYCCFLALIIWVLSLRVVKLRQLDLDKWKMAFGVKPLLSFIFYFWLSIRVSRFAVYFLLKYYTASSPMFISSIFAYNLHKFILVLLLKSCQSIALLFIAPILKINLEYPIIFNLL